MPRTNRSALAILLIALSLTTGCSLLLGGRNDPPRLYVLSAEPPAAAAAVAAAGSLGVGPVSLPGYLDRRGIVTRVEANRLEASRSDLWAEPLGASFKTVLEQDLRLRLPGVVLRTFPWAPGATPDLAVAVDVSRCEATGAGTVELHARWTLRRPGDRSMVAERDSAIVLPIAGAGADAMVSALSQAVGTLGDEIAAEVARSTRR